VGVGGEEGEGLGEGGAGVGEEVFEGAVEGEDAAG